MMTVRSLRPAIAAAAAILLVSVAMPAGAQDVPVVPAPPVDAAVAARIENQRLLTAALTRIAASGSDVAALAQAGRAALALGDPRAALGFLARAEQLAPRDPVIKAALGAVMVQLEDPQQAMRFFESAIALGGLERAYLADRGLAFDLLGDQPRAQADYAAAAQYAPSPEVTRRHAISLGISGNSEAAVQMLGPLLRTQDRGAWRSRAMIVAMNGRADEARQIAAATMPPQLASGLSPYFAMMDRLTPQQLAAAAHFGRFPSYDVVTAQPVRNSRRVEVAAASPVLPPARTVDRRAGRRAVAANTGVGGRTAQRTRTERQVASSGRVSPIPVPPVIVAPPPARVNVVAPSPPPPAVPTRTVPTPVTSPPVILPPVAPAVAAVAATPVPVAPNPPLQPVLRETIRPSIITPVPAAPETPAVRQVEGTTVSMTPMGPPDATGIRPGLTSIPPVQAPPPAQPAVTVVELPASTLPAVAAAPVSPVTAAPMPDTSVGVAPVPVAPPANTTVIAGWSLADMVGSITVPESEREVEDGALSIEELDRIATDRRRAAAVAAAEARRRGVEEARAREAGEAEARARAEREAEQRAEAETRRRHPPRVWVQVATGAEVAALAGDYRRFSQRSAEVFRGQSGHTAIWNRTRRLVVGPFANPAAARTWLNRHVAAGGEGFIWNSEQGEEVTPLARR